MATPVANSIPLTGNLDIDVLVQGSSWQLGADRTLTYSLDLEFDGTVRAWTPDWIDAVIRAFAAWEAVANIRIVPIGPPNQQYQNQSTADLSITLSPGFGHGVVAGLGVFPDPARADEILASSGYSRDSGQFPFPRPEGDISFDTNLPIFADLQAGSVGFEVILHEIGHALGLKHPEDDGGNGRPIRSNTAGDDSLMTNRALQDFITVSSPMLLDIQAIQRIYGANTAFHTGDDIYTLADQLRVIWDGGGNDTLDATNWGASTLDLRSGYFSTYAWRKVGIAHNAKIENAIGSAQNDVIEGNDSNNSINGGAGNDVMRGNGGHDTLIGGAGNDLFEVDSADDTAIEIARDGWDTIQSTASNYVLPANVESLRLMGEANIDATGNSANNELVGNSGNNRLDGGDGIDIMQGGRGDDVYVVGRSLPATHLWFSSETLPLVNRTSSNVYADSQTGRVETQALWYSWSSRIVVSIFNDVAGDSRKSEAWFTVPGYLATGNFTVGAGDAPYFAGFRYNVDGVTGDASSGNFQITDFAIDVSGANQVLTRFAARFDVTMYSRAFTGQVSFNSAALAGSIAVAELANDGNDTVITSTNCVLPDNIENLTLTGTDALIGIGNAMNNRLTGNSANNVLTGNAGDDTLAGGEGDDTATYAITRGQAVWHTEAGVITVTSSEGSDRLTQIEFLRFSDQTVYIGPNSAPTGSVSLIGNPTQGQTLTASNALSDADGVGAITYQWQSSGDGGSHWSNFAVDASTALTQAQVGKIVRVLASYTDGHGALETVASSATGIVANINDAPTAGAYGKRYAGKSELIALNLSALFNDLDGDTLSFAASSLPNGMSINANTGVITGTTPAVVGTHAITVSGTDPSNASASLNFSLRVIDGNTVSANVVTRGGSALPGVTADEFLSTTPAGSLYSFKNLGVDLNTTTGIKTLTAELFANGAGEHQSGFTLQVAGGATLQSFQLTGAVSSANGWAISETHPAGSYALSASHASAGIGADTLIGKIAIALPINGFGNDILMLSGATLGNQSSPDRSLSYDLLSIGNSGQTTMTLPDANLGLSFSRGTSDFLVGGITKPVTAADALDALKLSVGLPASQGNTWKELIAADITKDGRVTAADALEILTTSVGTSTIQPSWVFVPTDAATNPNLATMTRQAVSYKDEFNLAAITSPTSASITGILVGDVNNSWVIPT
ncbi:MAG: putative Ig domain-containing protein [Burkholderiales bacterium]